VQAGGETLIVPVVWPFLTGNLPPPLTGALVVDLFAALGQLPPSFTHWQVTVASAVTVMSTEENPVPPKPVSLNETSNWSGILGSKEALAK
jgi:hypothetical protein